jgi:hypothetical protein
MVRETGLRFAFEQVQVLYHTRKKSHPVIKPRNVSFLVRETGQRFAFEQRSSPGPHKKRALMGSFGAGNRTALRF